MRLNITVCSDYAAGGFFERGSTWLMGATTSNEVSMSNVNSMVDNVIARVCSSQRDPRRIVERISRLSIYDHGTRLAANFGPDRLSALELPRYESKLRQLTPYFEPNGLVVLCQCYAGILEDLLRRLAALWRVRVMGSTTQTSSFLPTIGWFPSNWRLLPPELGGWVAYDPGGQRHDGALATSVANAGR